MSGPYAKVIEDSVTEYGNRLTTFEVRFHRFVLAEFNTHRVFSRNSASSRAIPFEKQEERLLAGLAMPVAWPAEQKGMQGGEPLSERAQFQAEREWTKAAYDAIKYARRLRGLGYEADERLHKSVVNRLLEPFMWHTVVVTATAWGNWFGLRANENAQPEIRVAAEAMREAYDASEPKLLVEGQWHLPYIDNQDREWAAYKDPDRVLGHSTEGTLARISSARCARVSYLTQDGRRDPQVDLGLYDRLTSAWPMHASPLEHPATPDPENEHTVNIAPKGEPEMLVNLPRYGNLLGWRQHRFDVEAAKQYQAFS